MCQLFMLTVEPLLLYYIIIVFTPLWNYLLSIYSSPFSTIPTWWDDVKEDVKWFCLSQEDAQVQNSGSPLSQSVCVCVCVCVNSYHKYV